MTRFRVLPYKQGSRSAKALADALGGKVLKLKESRYKYRDGDVVINWGNTTFDNHNPDWPDGDGECFLPYAFNHQEDIARAANKLTFFQTIWDKDIIPPYWTNKEDIPDEVFNGDGTVVCRTILSGHSGAGIVLADARAGLVDAPLYVKYIKKQDEYRIHLGKTDEGVGVISAQRKAKRNGVDNVNWQIRNHQNGFVYVRNDVNPPEDVQRVAIEAFRPTMLDFGAVDVIWNEHRKKAYVLEINTAPGLEGQTVTDYANFFKRAIGV